MLESLSGLCTLQDTDIGEGMQVLLDSLRSIELKRQRVIRAFAEELIVGMKKHM